MSHKARATDKTTRQVPTRPVACVCVCARVCARVGSAAHVPVCADTWNPCSLTRSNPHLATLAPTPRPPRVDTWKSAGVGDDLVDIQPDDPLFYPGCETTPAARPQPFTITRALAAAAHHCATPRHTAPPVAAAVFYIGVFGAKESLYDLTATTVRERIRVHDAFRNTDGNGYEDIKDRIELADTRRRFCINGVGFKEQAHATRTSPTRLTHTPSPTRPQPARASTRASPPYAPRALTPPSRRLSPLAPSFPAAGLATLHARLAPSGPIRLHRRLRLRAGPLPAGGDTPRAARHVAPCNGEATVLGGAAVWHGA